MGKNLLGISPEYAYIHREGAVLLEEIHSPHFLAFCPSDRDVNLEREKLMERWKKGEGLLKHITEIGKVEKFKSFWDFEKEIDAFRVYVKRSFLVPEVSDYLFFNMDLYTAEHDIPYHQRVLIDMASQDRMWVLDTEGREERLKVLVYDIETTEFEEEKTDLPIDILGYTSFEVRIKSKKNLDEEDFYFDMEKPSVSWKESEIVQLVSRNRDEEIENLVNFCKILREHDIVSGHNIVGFDNRQMYGRIERFLEERGDNLSKEEIELFKEFLKVYARKDKSFHFGVGSEIVNIYPSTLDTYLGVRKFYPYLDDFGLKSVAQFLGIEIEGRVYLLPSQIKMDDRTLQYNKHDVMEQAGVTMQILEQALPLAFTTCMPFDMLLEAGAVNMWDHMAMIRATRYKKIIPPTAKVLNVSKFLVKKFPGERDKKRLTEKAKKVKEQLSKEVIRVLKYGEEMPDWVSYPDVIYNGKAKDGEEALNYHIPGGMTIKPDKDAKSDFIPWYYVIVADVGAMYPTILKALNIGADVVKLARKGEKPDSWIWLKYLPKGFLEDYDVAWREIGKDEEFADTGVMIGIRVSKEAGVVNRAMTGIMNVIGKIKEELKKTSDPDRKKRLKMIYQSLKGARNAGTHGILSAPTVSGRQFNLWGAAAITTKGQEILFHTIKKLKEKGVRIVYGDTDGIYIACSRSMASVPELAKSLGIVVKDGDSWITKPEVVLRSIEECSELWRRNLNYKGFELEPEKHDAMIFVKHKNYLIFDGVDGRFEMITKGNSFKGSDKANIARKALEMIMKNVLLDNCKWEDEKEARKRVKESIKERTKEVVRKLDLKNVDIDDLILVQSVQPAKRYQLNKDGTLSTYGRRAKALEKLIGEKIKSRVKFKFVVTKKPLPGIPSPSKSGVKPIEYMYPVEFVKDLNEIDLEWYKKMIENYIKGAFGLYDLSTAPAKQVGLDSWM